MAGERGPLRSSVRARPLLGQLANALHRRVLRQEVTQETAIRLMESLLASGIELREASDLHRRALILAGRLRQNAVYDAHYLALAETLQCEFWTADEKFYRAAATTMGNVRWVGESDAHDV